MSEAKKNNENHNEYNIFDDWKEIISHYLEFIYLYSVQTVGNCWCSKFQIIFYMFLCEEIRGNVTFSSCHTNPMITLTIDGIFWNNSSKEFLALARIYETFQIFRSNPTKLLASSILNAFVRVRLILRS